MYGFDPTPAIEQNKSIKINNDSKINNNDIKKNTTTNNSHDINNNNNNNKLKTNVGKLHFLFFL